MKNFDILLQFRSNRNKVAPVNPIVPSVSEQINTGNNILVSVEGLSVYFDKPFDSLTIDYTLIVSCNNNDGIIAYRITNKTNLGFTIVPADNATLEYIAVAK